MEGMTKEEVRAKLGNPHDVYRNDSKERWIYTGMTATAAPISVLFSDRMTE